jgi:hypothetical protein
MPAVRPLHPDLDPNYAQRLDPLTGARRVGRTPRERRERQDAAPPTLPTTPPEFASLREGMERMFPGLAEARLQEEMQRELARERNRLARRRKARLAWYGELTKAGLMVLVWLCCVLVVTAGVVLFLTATGDITLGGR